MNKLAISRQLGLAQTVILLVLAVLSYSLVGRFVDHTSRWITHFRHMEIMQTAKIQTANYLQDIVLSLKTDSVHAELKKSMPKLKLNGTISEQIIKVDQKETTYFNVRAEAVDLYDATNLYQHEVILRKRKRLENPFIQAVSVLNATDLNVFTKLFFSLESDAFKLLSTHTNQTTQKCSNLNHSATGLLWFNTKCRISDTTLGSIERPVIIVIENAEFSMESTHIVGVIIHLCDDAVKKRGVISITSSLTGALISFCGTPQIQGNIHYSVTALEELIQHDDNVEFTIVEGSWRSL